MARVGRPRRKEFVFPDDLIIMVARPFAKSLGMRYIPNTPSVLFKNIIQKLAAKSRDKSIKLEPIINNIIDIVTPLSKYLELGAAFLQPFIRMIPPEYMTIVIAVLAVIPIIATIIPLRIIGVLLYYLAEKYFKLPFFGKPKIWIDKMPDYLKKYKYTISKITTTRFSGNYIEFFKLSKPRREAYKYETDITMRTKLTIIETNILAKFPESEWTKILLALPAPPVDFSLYDTFSLTAHWYYGKGAVLPPIFQVIIELTHKMIDNFETVITWFKINIETLVLSILNFLGIDSTAYQETLLNMVV